MSEKIRKITAYFIASVLAAGAIFICGFCSKLPEGTFINGIDVGGMKREAAVRAVREEILSDLKNKNLKICSDENVYTFAYPEISFKDDVRELAGRVRKKGNYLAKISYRLNGLDSIVSGICGAEFRKVIQREAIFNPDEGQPFSYVGGQSGVSPDSAALKRDVIASLSEGKYGEDFAPVILRVKKTQPSESMQSLKERTALLSAFTTYFDSDNQPRAQNIRLAGSKISGAKLSAGEVFSFNGCVGERTKANGFRQAKIILNGEYVYGTGGGVCQVSTTLYNAALLAGLKVTEYHPHSLAVGYVSPSRDAMVSGTYCDLKFENTTNSTVYIRVLTGKNFIRCEFYGLSDGSTYSLSSVVIESDAQSGNGGGVRSECYIIKSCGGREVRRLLRRDHYLPLKTTENIRDEIEGDEIKGGDSD